MIIDKTTSKIKAPLAFLLPILIKAAALAMVLALGAFGLLHLVIALGFSSNSIVGEAVMLINTPGFLTAWFSRGGNAFTETVQLIGTNWCCWFWVCFPIMFVVALLRRKKGVEPVAPADQAPAGR